MNLIESSRKFYSVLLKFKRLYVAFFFKVSKEIPKLLLRFLHMDQKVSNFTVFKKKKKKYFIFWEPVMTIIVSNRRGKLLWWEIWISCVLIVYEEGLCRVPRQSRNLHFGNINKTNTEIKMGPRLGNKNTTHTHIRGESGKILYFAHCNNLGLVFAAWEIEDWKAWHSRGDGPEAGIKCAGTGIEKGGVSTWISNWVLLKMCKKRLKTDLILLGGISHFLPWYSLMQR